MEKIEQEQRQSNRDLALKRLGMEQEIERMKLSQGEKLEGEKQLKTYEIEIQAKETPLTQNKETYHP